MHKKRFKENRILSKILMKIFLVISEMYFYLKKKVL